MSFINALQGMGNSLFGGSRQIDAGDLGKDLLSGLTEGKANTGGVQGSGSSGFQSMLSQAGGARNADAIVSSLNSENVSAAAQDRITQMLNGESPDAYASAAPTGDAFVSSLSGFINSVNDKDLAAEQASTDIMTGKSDNIHQAMISMQEASISFDLLVQVRDKLVDAYKELSRMTV